ncbi:MBL fold metallo-hydrolase [Streptacidiphilus sp. N1-3]|uniref:MBL fold metallo-hydrolase n=1 Tax=Streptacidiphilus alkalitolerans TaxID=3342712 RepID=A0ABV6X1W3_9ACTN
MSSTVPVQTVADGVDRLGDRAVNFYLVHHPDGLLLIDAGLPGHLAQLQRHLAALGREPADIKAVLLTHAHPDHTGLVAPLHRAGAEVWVQRQDAAILSGGPRSAMRLAKPEGSMLRYLLRRPSGIGAPLHMARNGGFTAPPFADAREFEGDTAFETLPGRPRAVAVPGHTSGSTAYVFEDRGLVFTGDALVTHDGLTGRRGPGTVSRAFTHDSAAALASLDRLPELPDAVLLPGHGDPFTGGIAAATAEARRRGVA